MRRSGLSTLMGRTIVGAALLLSPLLGSAQILTFDFASASGSEGSYASNSNDARLNTSTITRGSGISASGNGGRFNATGWTTGASLDPDDYMEFTISPLSGKTFSISSVVVQLQRSSTGPGKLALRTSNDAYATNAGSEFTIVDNTSTQTATFTFSLIDQASDLTLRLYFYASESAGGSCGPGDGAGDDIVVNGTTADAVTGTSVEFANTTSSATEDGGAFNLAISITNPGIAATSMDITATDPNSRLTSYSATVTFPGGSSSPQNVVVTPNNNAICDGDEDIVFTISNVSGGNMASPGTNSTNTLSLTDDDVCVNTTVQFASTTGTVPESVGSFNIQLSITDFSATNNTDVTIGATDPDGRITTFTSSVTFFATSGFDENMNITVDDNAICQLDGDVVFTILSVTGGEGMATVGINNTFTLTITDNDPVATPTATTPTVVNSNDFTATWNAAAGATGYELDVYTDGAVPASELFFSEYVEGSSNNKYLEIFNGTGATVDLSHYTVQLFTNGNTSPGATNILSGSLVDGSVIVLENSSASVYLGAATSASACGYNGDDAILLLNNVTGDTLDIIGRIGEDPGAAWGTGVLTTAEHSLVRNASITGGVTSNPASGFPTLSSDWSSFAQDNVSNLGSHTFSGTGETMVFGFPAVLGNVTSYGVTGLDPLTLYHYRVRATGGSCPTTANSNTIDVTTAAGSDPLLTAGTLADFGARCLDVASEAHDFSLDGVNLTATDVTVGPLSGFTFSTSEFGTYTVSLTLTPASGVITETVWVIFTPTAEITYDGDIDIMGGGAPSITVAAQGSGINTAASVSTGTATSVALDQATVAGTIEDGGCSALSSYGIEYSTASFTPGSGTQVPSSNLATGEFSSDLTGLSPCTMYWFVAYATNNGGTTYGTESSFSTDAISVPVATTPTVINNTDFTATWNAVTGSTGYRLDVSTDANFGLSSTTVTNGFNSGRAGVGPDGWSHSGLGTDYNSDGGVATPSIKFDTSTDELVSPVFPGAATSVSFWYKGQGTAGTGSTLLIEASTDGIGWTSIGSLSNLATNATGTETIPLLASNGYVQFRFTYTKVTGNFAFDDASVTYVSGTPSYVAGYDNLAVAGTSQSVTGLTAGTDYYYRVRAESATCPLVNSNTMAVTTTGGACIGNEMVLRINTDGSASQISWVIKDGANATVASGSPVGNNTQVDETLCLSNANGDCYTLELMDSFGDGITGGGWELRTTDGKTILKDSFSGGSVSPANPTLTPVYGSGHPFCLPLGPATLKSTECGLFNNTLNNRIYANPMPGATQYEFQFLDPDAGYVRSIIKPSASMLFIDMGGSVNPLVPGVHYFVRIRTNAGGPLAAAHYGPGCEMGMNAAAVVHCTQLINGTLYGHSCNETRAFGSPSYSFIYATPVLGASAYTFHIYIAGEPELFDTTITRGTYVLQLKWPGGTPLTNGSTYNVDVKATVNGVTSNYCTPFCTITIDNTYTGMGGELTQVDGSFNGDVQMWPNPVADGRVNLALNGLVDTDQQIQLDLYDKYGRKVMARDYGNSGSSFSTVLELPSEVTSGVYLVHITVNGVSTVQRLSVVR